MENQQIKVLVTGVFDILHQEHIIFLKKAKKLGNYLVIGLESDVRVSQMKGVNRPVNNQFTRVNNLEKLKIANEIFVLPEKFSKPEDHINLIKKVKPKFLAVSSHTKHIDRKRAIMSKFAGEVVVVHDFNPRISTSKLLEEGKVQ